MKEGSKDVQHGFATCDGEKYTGKIVVVLGAHEPWRNKSVRLNPNNLNLALTEDCAGRVICPPNTRMICDIVDPTHHQNLGLSTKSNVNSPRSTKECEPYRGN